MDAQLRLLLDANVAGETRVLGLESLAADPLFVQLAGGGVPSIDTVYRDLDRFDHDAIRDLEAIVFRRGLDVRALRRHGDVHCDIDSTVEPLFGEREGGALGHNPRYHGRPSYHPLVARVAETDTCIGAQLRPGDTGFGNDDVPFVRRVVGRLRAVLSSRQRLVVRVDAAADCEAIMRAVVAEKAFFVVKARATSDLLGAVLSHQPWHTVDRDAFDEPLTQVAEIPFQREVWKHSGLGVRVVAVRTREPGAGKQICLWEGDDYAVKLYLTNLPDRLEDVVRRYDDRAGIEPLIAEWKNGWGIAEVPSYGFIANHAMLLIKLLAHNLLHAFVRLIAPALRDWRVHWIRRALVCVVGKLVRHGRRWTLLVAPRSALARLLE
jgi:hypothetical protein